MTVFLITLGLIVSMAALAALTAVVTVTGIRGN
jgi:hypothetical protein